MSYDFNCPQYVDFSRPLIADDNADEYFNFDHENGGHPVDFGYSSITADMESPSSSMYMDAVSPAAMTPGQEDEPVKEQVDETEEKPEAEAPVVPSKRRVPPNLCSSLEAWNAKKASSGNRMAAAKNNNRNRQRQRPAMRRSQVERPRESTQSPRAKRRKSNITEEPEAKSPRTRAGSHVRSMSASRVRRISAGRARTLSHDHPGLRHSANTGVGDKGSQENQATSTTGQRSDVCTQKSGHRRTATHEGRSRTASVDRSRPVHRRTGTGGSIEKEHALPKKIVAQAPSLLTRIQQQRSSQLGNLKSSEELEMERIQKMKQNLAKTRKMAQDSYRKVQTSKGPLVARSVQAPTMVEGFHFATDSRLKGSHTDDQDNEKKNKNFESQLRSNGSTSSGQPLRRTIPQPFNLHEGGSRKRSRAECDKNEDTYKFHSMAETVIAFSNKTPDRFHRKSAKDVSIPSKDPPTKMKLTVAHTPQLQTRIRHRPVTIKSQQDIDEEEVERIKSYKFRARPVNQKIMDNPNTGVPRVEPKAVTRPEEFNLESEHRYPTRNQAKGDDEELSREFHAKPVPKGILEQPQGIRPAKHIPLTHPQSPAFALRNRLRAQMKDVESEVLDEEEKRVRANPVPHIGIPFQPKLDHKITAPKPFSFENRDKRTMTRKQQKIYQVFEEEKRAREFRANPIPDLSPDLPPRKAREPTRPKPFQLEVDERGSKKAEEWSHKMEEELKQQRQNIAFKAQPNITSYTEPFLPKRSAKALTDITQFDLSTETRCEKREQFETWKKDKELERAAAEAAWEKERLDQEKEQIARMRVENVHKAKPVRKYRPVEIKASEKPITEPHTPRFSERLKSRSGRH